MKQLETFSLEEIYSRGIPIHEAFTDANYPARQATGYDEEGNKRPKDEKGGAELAREYLYSEGNKVIPSYLITLLLKEQYSIAIQHSMSPEKRKKRATCSLEELNDEIMIDEKYINLSF